MSDDARQHLGERQRRNQGEQAAAPSMILSDEALAVEHGIAEGHRKAAADSRLNGQDAAQRLEEHRGEYLAG
jgi:hypothetical protein